MYCLAGPVVSTRVNLYNISTLPNYGRCARPRCSILRSAGGGGGRVRGEGVGRNTEWQA